MKTMRKTKFQICDDERNYEGYTDGRLWNGWECPWFTKEVAEQIMRDLNRDGVETEYDATTDSYIIQEEEWDLPGVFEGYDVETEDGIKHLYPIGAWCWIWDEVQEEYLDDDEYVPSAENGDYSPSNPWDAPGMSIRDFI